MDITKLKKRVLSRRCISFDGTIRRYRPRVQPDAPDSRTIALEEVRKVPRWLRMSGTPSAGTAKRNGGSASTAGMNGVSPFNGGGSRGSSSAAGTNEGSVSTSASKNKSSESLAGGNGIDAVTQAEKELSGLVM